MYSGLSSWKCNGRKNHLYSAKAATASMAALFELGQTYAIGNIVVILPELIRHGHANWSFKMQNQSNRKGFQK